MPWEKRTVEESRKTFVEEYLEGIESMSALCRKHGISRPTGYKWVERYKNGDSLSDLSRAPRTHPFKTPPEIEAKILDLRGEHPGTGARKLEHILRRRGVDVPCVSTINAILKRNGYITQEASQAAQRYRRFEASKPNGIWQADFKGNFVMQDSKRCYPLNILDDNSRFCLCSAAQDNERYEDTAANFRRTFQEYGLPRALLCDNGNPWGTSQSVGYTRFEVWLLDLDILPMHGRSLHPQTQGKQERFNGSLKREKLNFVGEIADLAHAQAILDDYRSFYNNERPHEALGMETPATRYQPSLRPFPDAISPWTYDTDSVFRVKSSGYLSFRGQGCFLSEAFGGLDIAIVPAEDQQDCLDLVYRNFRVARFDLQQRCIVSRKPRRINRTA